MNGIRRQLALVALLLLVAEPSAALNIPILVDGEDHEILIYLDRGAIEFDREALALFMIDDAIADSSFAPRGPALSDTGADWEISLNRVLQ